MLQPMTSSTPPLLPNECHLRMQKLLFSGGRKILGIADPPGSGKSTLASLLQAAYPKQTQVVPMDGFHLANSELARLGRTHQKGAPETFDADGYINLLSRIKKQLANTTIHAPEFRREIEEPIAGAIAIDASTSIIITEGNYLLLEENPWSDVRQWLDEVWFVGIDGALRQERLVTRHVRFGKTKEQAKNWVLQTDEPNAIRIEKSKNRADWVIPAV